MLIFDISSLRFVFPSLSVATKYKFIVFPPDNTKPFAGIIEISHSSPNPLVALALNSSPFEDSFILLDVVV